MSEGRSTSEKDYIQLDALAEKIGEDPGRYLDGPLDPLPRIRGLMRLKRVHAYRGAERRIANIRGREPRQRIMDALDRREAYLEEHGEFDPEPRHVEIVFGLTPENIDDVLGPRKVGAPPRITPHPGPSWDEDDVPEHETRIWDPERYARIRGADSAEVDSGEAVATDGGEPSDE